jgi:hypothetical protein
MLSQQLRDTVKECEDQLDGGCREQNRINAKRWVSVLFIDLWPPPTFLTIFKAIGWTLQAHSGTAIPQARRNGA